MELKIDDIQQLLAEIGMSSGGAPVYDRAQIVDIVLGSCGPHDQQRNQSD